MTSQEPEQIGELIFIQNPDYPYPFKVERPPHFWMTEQTGALAEAVDAYMDGLALSARHLELIRLYLTQYIERAVLTGDANRSLLVQQANKLKHSAEIEAFADELAEYGIEPF
jgi:hypothetical protein